ncbi:hypothetical protein COSO111634_30225 [Corallococcus soli]
MRCSVSVTGAAKGVSVVAAGTPGAGRAARSSLPPGVRGSASIRTKEDGTKASGRRSLRKRRTAGSSRDSSATTQAHSRVSPATSRGSTTA